MASGMRANILGMATVDRAVPETDLDRLCVDTIRGLAIDGVQRANSGHPGMPMAMAPVAYLLDAHVLRHNPRNPRSPDRDRFALRRSRLFGLKGVHQRRRDPTPAGLRHREQVLDLD
jgi:hypothetical protein